jgi:transposase-like protein
MQMECPRCRSGHLAIKQVTGFERVMVFLTKLRMFRCRDCYFDFRAPDRRRTAREKEDESMVIVRGL